MNTEKDSIESLKEKIKELEKAKEEIEFFIYIVSHDLKTPLRGILTFAEFLVKDHKEKLDKEGQELITEINKSVILMKNRLEALLEYSRLCQNDLVIEEVVLNDVLKDIPNQITMTDKSSLIGIEGLKSEKCDKEKIQKVFKALIENGFLFNKSENKSVEVGVKQGEPKVYFVKDNGIGIKEEYQDKVFQIFKRLHGEDDYGGGLGASLALVKKIIEKHGGKIWIESKEGVGSTFYFTLKKEV